MDKHKPFIALILVGWVVLCVIGFMYRDKINVLYYLPVLALLKILFINRGFVSGYTGLVESESKSYWFLPVVMEHSIFSPRYAKITGILVIIIAALGLLSYLMLGLDMSIPGVDPLNRENFVSNVIYIAIIVYILYSLVVGLGYLEIDLYIDSIYKKKFPIHKLNKTRRWNLFLYFIPIIRMLPMLEAWQKCEKLTKFYNLRAHEGREEIV